MSTEEIHQIVVGEHDTPGSSQVLGTEPSLQVHISVPESEYLAPSGLIYEQVHAALEAEIQRKDAAGTSRSLIWTVPAKYRNNNAEHYKPVSWRFGLHNCPDDTLLNSVTEGFKIKVAGALQLSGQLWNQFCEEVVKEPKEHWDAVYDESSQARSYSIEEIRCLLSLDALFLVVFLQAYALEKDPARRCPWFPMGTKTSTTPGKCPTLGIEEETIYVSKAVDLVMKNPVLQIYKDTLWHDIWLVGNQIPIELLQRVVGILTRRKCHESLGDVIMPAWEHDDWQTRNILHCVPWNFFYGPSIDTTKKDNLFQKRMKEALRHPDSCHGIHILDSVYCILRGHTKRFQGSHFYYFQNVGSATYLEACGVMIRGKEFTCFEDITFENGVLKVPFL